MSQNRYAKRIDANQPEIVEALEDMGYTVEIDVNDIFVGAKGFLNFWYELKDERALDKNGNIRESEIKPSQKKLRDTWNGHYKIVSSLDQILDDMREVFQRLGL